MRQTARSVVFVCAFLLSTACTFVLVATTYSRRGWLRLLLLASFTLLATDLLTTKARWLRSAQLMVLGLILAMNLVTPYADKIFARWPRLIGFQWVRRWAWASTAALVILMFFGSWATLGVSAFAKFLFSSIGNLAFLVLAPVLVLAGTDFAEMAEFAAERFVENTHYLRTAVIAALTLVLALGNAGFGLWRMGLLDSGNVGFASWRTGRILAINAAIVVILTALVVRVIQRLELGLGSHTPPPGLLIGLSLGLYFMALLLTYTDFHNELIGLVSCWSVPFAMYGFPEVWLTDRREARVSGFLYMVAVGAFAIFMGLSVWALRQAGTIMDLRTVIFYANASVGTGSVLAIMIAPLWKLPVVRLQKLLRAVLGLNIGFILLTLLACAFLLASTKGEELSTVQAILVLVTLGWDLWMSGNTTNHDGHFMPRRGRVLLYLAYVTTVAAGVLMLSPRWLLYESPGTTTFSAEIWPPYGVVALGFPLLLAAVVRPIRECFTPAPICLPNFVTGPHNAVVRILSKYILRAALVVTWLTLIFLPVLGLNLFTPHGIPEDWRQSYSATGEFELYYPGTWTRGGRPQGALLFAFETRDPPDTFPARVTVYAESWKNPVALASHVEEQISALRREARINRVEHGPAHLPAGDSELINADFVWERQELVFRDYVLIRGDTIYDLVFTATAARAAQQERTFTLIARSLHFF